MGGRWAIVAVLLVLAAGVTPAAAEDSADPAQALLDRYAPVIVVRDQEALCGPGEPYRPTEVQDVLGRPDVALTDDAGRVLATAPSASDLGGLGPDHHLDFPGDPLAPGCEYEEWSAEISADTPVTVHGRVAADPDHPGMLVAQYWFWWVFNDWNNKHEGDWEMVQVVFAADNAQQALATPPVAVGFAQHEGAEVADWDDPKLIKDGDHLVVYPSEGSHAAYYNQARWLGTSADAGFGCDDTSVSPTVGAVALRPEVVVLPHDPDPADERFGWLAYEGRWGQAAPSFNNGPTGPNLKDRWEHPVTWQLAGRDGAIALPPVPGPAVSAFCSVTAAGSLLFIELLRHPILTVLALAIAVIAAWLLVRATTWRGSDPRALSRSRSPGQIITGSVTVYAARWRSFAAVSLLLLVALGAAALLRDQVLSPVPTGDITDTAGRTALLPYLDAWLLGAVIVVPAALISYTAALVLVSRPLDPPDAGTAVRVALRRQWPWLTVALLYLIVVASAASLVLLPLGAWALAVWSAAPPAVLVEKRRMAAGLSRSRELTRGQRWRTLATAVGALLLALVPGPLIGTVLVVITDWPFLLLNLLVSAWYAVAVPMLAIASMLLYYDLIHRFDAPAAARPRPAPSPA